jgi:hypothetical protein
MDFRLWLENSLRDFILKTAEQRGFCDSEGVRGANCRLFTQIVADPDVDVHDYPEVSQDDIQVGDIIVWGRYDGDYFEEAHYAFWLGNNEILEVPRYNAPMQIRKIMKSLTTQYGKPAKIVRPNWQS